MDWSLILRTSRRIAELEGANPASRNRKECKSWTTFTKCEARAKAEKVAEESVKETGKKARKAALKTAS